MKVTAGRRVTLGAVAVLLSVTVSGCSLFGGGGGGNGGGTPVDLPRCSTEPQVVYTDHIQASEGDADEQTAKLYVSMFALVSYAAVSPAWAFLGLTVEDGQKVGDAWVWTAPDGRLELRKDGQTWNAKVILTGGEYGSGWTSYEGTVTANCGLITGTWYDATKAPASVRYATGEWDLSGSVHRYELELLDGGTTAKWAGQIQGGATASAGSASIPSLDGDALTATWEANGTGSFTLTRAGDAPIEGTWE